MLTGLFTLYYDKNKTARCFVIEPAGGTGAVNRMKPGSKPYHVLRIQNMAFILTAFCDAFVRAFIRIDLQAA